MELYDSDTGEWVHVNVPPGEAMAVARANDEVLVRVNDRNSEFINIYRVYLKGHTRSKIRLGLRLG